MLRTLLSLVLALTVTGAIKEIHLANPQPTGCSTDYYVSVMQEINKKLPEELCKSILDRIGGNDTALHLAIMWQESDLRDSMLRGDNGRSLGYYQLGLWEARTIDRTVTRSVLLTIENVYYGSRYLESLLGRYSLVEALRVYNGAYRYAYQVIARKNAIESGRIFDLTPRQLYRLRWLKTMKEAEEYA